MYGLDGRISRTQTKMTWDEFSKWQRWDEYVLQTESWEVVASDKCFLRLLTKPLEVFGGHSFQELIQELEFDA